MKARRVILDVVIVVAVLGLLASPYLLPERQCQFAPPIALGRVSTAAPSFSWQTNAGAACTAVTLTVSNASPFDIEWYVDWFECRPMQQLSLLEPRVGLAATNVLRSGAVGQTTVFVSGSTNREHACCYSIRWGGRAGALIRTVEGPAVLKRWLRNNPIWGPVSQKLRRAECEQGWAFGSSLEVGEYFRRVHGLDEQRWGSVQAEESRNAAALDKAAHECLRLRWFRRPSDSETAVEEADQALKAAVAASQHTLVPVPVRSAYHIWSEQKSREMGAPVAASNGGPIRPPAN